MTIAFGIHMIIACGIFMINVFDFSASVWSLPLGIGKVTVSGISDHPPRHHMVIASTCLAKNCGVLSYGTSVIIAIGSVTRIVFGT